jgi:hypothetical protein
MKLLKTLNSIVCDERLVWIAIVIACVAAFTMMATQKNQTGPAYEMWFSDYPSEMNSGQDLSFSLIIKNQASSEQGYVLDIFFDTERQRSENVTVGPKSQEGYNFTLENGFRFGETHRVKVVLYQSDVGLLEYGSKNLPHNIYFDVVVR